jgi:hypothetical protein
MMQALQSQTDLPPNTASQTLERSVEEFQDAVSRHLPMLHKRAYRYLGNSNDVEDAVQTPSCLPTSTWISSRAARR